MALKGNQGTLHEDIKLYFTGTKEEKLGQPPFDYYKTVVKDHGRIEKREYWVTADIDWLTMKEGWKGLQSICMMKSERTLKEKTSTEIFYYIASLPADAKKAGTAIRSHWGT